MGIFSRKKEPVTFFVKDIQIICPVCKNEYFTQRTAQLNTALASFFRLDWTNKTARCLVCSNCTHILWFES